MNSYINIVPDPIDTTLVDISQQDFITTFNYSVTIERGTLYNVTGFGSNVIGNGSSDEAGLTFFFLCTLHAGLILIVVKIFEKILPSVATSAVTISRGTSVYTGSLLPSSTTVSSDAGVLVSKLGVPL